MGIRVFLNKPPANIEQWIKNQRLKQPLCFTAVDAGATIAFNKVGSPDAANIVTSTDGQTWEPYTFNTTITLANVSDKVYFRAADENDISFYKDSSNYYRFATTDEKKIAASGNIQTLMKANGSRLDISGKSSCYAHMFSGCTSLTAAPALPATTLADFCYSSMFAGCTSLTAAPALPATTLADFCYSSMFAGCSSLSAAPELPATELASGCYYQMFYNCTSLTTAPELPATTLVNSCYSNMFQSCTSLTTAPKRLATTLAGNCCSNMFSGCTSLTSAPELPATTLAENCYNSMFSNCTSLTTAPELPATTLIDWCYVDMFYNCSKLTSINVSFTTWDTNKTSNWVKGVAASGTFTCPNTLPGILDVSNIPYGWTKVNK